ncbi:methionyl-tRNA formyltransferase [Sediminitomix flava]|uniref:Methionyl-tRNA formyltransferase n=1 Tax=Sediminitomix flava TaxID=379075 RepID=A0A315Z601_SEDFL|nr:methionyl-tRNA formyltransferase [Sediminitomix flava]PWJ39287.1 methionyl-tRNA formyltransferase [Sediminitomix flava]
MKKDLRIIFMGTPDFAVPSLEVLVANNYNVVAVITAPDKPAGRGRKLQQSPVKECALKHNLTVLQPTNLKNPEFLEELKSYNANLQIVVAFRMLPVAVWDMPELGTFNLHGSLLPQYRGAAPINWAIMNGETETGVTTFFLRHEIDTGDMILQKKEPIADSDTVGDVYGRLMNIGGEAVLETVKLIEEDKVNPIPQPMDVELKSAPKIFKETCEVDFSKTTKDVYDFIRGLSPYPAAWTEIEGVTYKLFNVEKVMDEKLEGDEKGYVTDNKTFFYIKTADGYISVKNWQMQGKKRMDIEAFLRGKQF